MRWLILLAGTTASVSISGIIIDPYQHGEAYHVHDETCPEWDWGDPAEIPTWDLPPQTTINGTPITAQTSDTGADNG